MRIGQYKVFTLFISLSLLTLFFNNCSETDFVLPQKNNLASKPPEQPSFFNSSLTEELAGIWFFDETKFGSAPGFTDFEDSSGNGNHASSIALIQLGIEGKINNALNINNNNQESINIPDSDSLDVSLAATFSIWIRSAPPSTTAKDVSTSVFEKVNTDNDPSFMLYLGKNEIPNKMTFRPHIYAAGTLSHSNWKYGAIDYDIQPLKWYHVVYSYDSVTGLMKGYIDGVEHPIVFTNEPSPGDQIRKGTAPLLVGKGTRGGGHLFNGDVDEMAIWSRVLKPEEIQALFLRGTPN